MKTGSKDLCKSCLASLGYPVVKRGIRWSLSGIYMYSGVTKLLNPQRFAEVISGFGLLPHALIFPAAILLPILEVVAGAGLVFSLRWPLAAITGMLVLFMAVLVYGIHLGLDIDCGCFGPEDPEQAYKGLRTALARDMVMMTGVIFLYWSRGRSRVETGRLEQ